MASSMEYQSDNPIVNSTQLSFLDVRLNALEFKQLLISMETLLHYNSTTQFSCINYLHSLLQPQFHYHNALDAEDTKCASSIYPGALIFMYQRV